MRKTIALLLRTLSIEHKREYVKRQMVHIAAVQHAKADRSARPIWDDLGTFSVWEHCVPMCRPPCNYLLPASRMRTRRGEWQYAPYLHISVHLV